MNRDDLQKENIVRIFQLSNAIQTYIDRLLKPNNLTTKQFFMMIILGTFEEDPRIGEISERFMTSRQNVKQVLRKLQSGGFVKLYKDESDSRITRVCFTEQANAFWAKRDIEDSESMSKMFEDLSIEELSGLQRSFIKLTNKMEEMNR